jgi:hypothetical protein
VLQAQLSVFMETSASFADGDKVHTQALFNFVTHLKHWAPGFVGFGAKSALPFALGKLGPGAPSDERDRKLAVLVTRWFYGNANRGRWIPCWKPQFLEYARHHMKEDGLDCSGEPVFQAPAPPKEKREELVCAA